MSAADLAWLAAQVYGGGQAAPQSLADAQWAQALQAQAQAAPQAAMASTAPISSASIQSSSDINWAAQFAGFQQNKHLDASALQGMQAGPEAWAQQMQQLQGLTGGCGVVVPGCAKGMGKGGGGGKPSMPRMETDAIYIAVNTAMQAVLPDDIMTATDGAWDAETLKRRLAKYFRSAAKGMSFEGPPEKVINNFADAALGNVIWALQGTKFLAKADFTLVIEVSVGELFPESFRESNPDSSQLQDAILKAHDRALEEARFAPGLQESVKSIVEGKKAQNKVYNAAEAARRDVVNKLVANQDDSSDFFYATENGVMGKVEEFASDWITATIKQLGDWPESVIECKDAVTLFDKLFSSEEACLPRSLMQYMVEPLPQPWDFIATTLKGIYKVSADKHAAEVAAAGPKKRKMRDEGPNWQYKTVPCMNMANEGVCKMGDWCVFAHGDEELYMHKGAAKGMVYPDKGGKGPGMDFGKGKDFGKGYPEMDYGKGKDFGKGSPKGPYSKGYDGDFSKGSPKGYDSMQNGEYDDGYGKSKGGKGSWGKGPTVPQGPAAKWGAMAGSSKGKGGGDYGKGKGAVVPYMEKGGGDYGKGGGDYGKGGSGKSAKGPPRPSSAPQFEGGYDEGAADDEAWGPPAEPAVDEWGGGGGDDEWGPDAH